MPLNSGYHGSDAASGALSPADVNNGGMTSSLYSFYKHGLMCASYPRLVLVFTVSLVVVACFPLLTLPIYSHRPQTLVQNMSRNEAIRAPAVDTSRDGGEEGGEGEVPPEWREQQRPLAFVQQVVMRAMVHPYNKEELIRTDAFRGPLASAFKLHLEDLTTFRDTKSGSDMDHECLRTDGLSPRYRSINILPDYGCLILSPANLWSKDSVLFQMDPNLLSTLFSYQRSYEGHSSLTDLVFGMRQRESGITKYPMRNRQRVISYAATVALKDHNPTFVAALKTHLQKVYPLHQEDAVESDVAASQTHQQQQQVVHIYFPPVQQYYGEMLPLLVTVFVLFLYVYFSVNKIEVVRSKVGLATSAVTHVLLAIGMSLGLSHWLRLGISLNINPKVYFVPYLVAFISLENILVVTRAVIETPAHLDVKIRVAQGLSKEGGNIAKNLLAEITVLFIGFIIGCLSDRSIQEFCLLAFMGLLADFFLQMCFFVTVLSMDLTTLELSDLIRKPVHGVSGGGSGSSGNRKMFRTPVSGPGLFRKSSAEIGGGAGAEGTAAARQLNGDSCCTNVMAPNCNGRMEFPKEAKRVKLLSLWARKRFIQRLFVLSMLVFISVFIYQGLTVLLSQEHPSPLPAPLNELHDALAVKAAKAAENATPKDQEAVNNNSSSTNAPRAASAAPTAAADIMNLTLADLKEEEEEAAAKAAAAAANTLKKLQASPADYAPWQRLPYTHWPMLFGLYNMSLYGQYITLLPPIQLAMTISPESAVSLRHPREVEINSKKSCVDEMASAGSSQRADDEQLIDQLLLDDYWPELSPFAPTTFAELVIAFVFATPSILFMLYLLKMLYRCCCSKNYAEWRTSWKDEASANDANGDATKKGSCSSDRSKTLNDIYTQMVQESSLIQAEGHRHEIEYLVTDCNTIISMCLDGIICIWDSYSGEKLAHIDRARYISNSDHCRRSDVESPSSSSGFASQLKDDDVINGGDGSFLGGKINTNFSMLATATTKDNCGVSPPTKSPYNFHRFNQQQQQQGRVIQRSISDFSSSSSGGHQEQHVTSPDVTTKTDSVTSLSSVWAVEISDGFLVLGCSSGRIELWDVTTGSLRCSYDDESRTGVTHLRLCGSSGSGSGGGLSWSRLVVARIGGNLDLFRIIQPTSGSSPSAATSSVSDGIHHQNIRHSSSSPFNDRWPPRSLSFSESTSSCPSLATREQQLDFQLVFSTRAHQQPITCLVIDNDTILTGSQDHTLRILRFEERSFSAVYTLHGHCGPITSAFIDRQNPDADPEVTCAGSGSQDGMLCLWDVMTGACLYSIQAHDGCVLSMTHSPSYVVSMGMDDKLCVWERFQGHLINTINLTGSSPYCRDLIMLTHNLLVTGTLGQLIVWDVRLPDPVKRIRLGSSDATHSISMMHHFAGDTIACNYGNQLRIVRFPMLTDKKD